MPVVRRPSNVPLSPSATPPRAASPAATTPGSPRGWGSAAPARPATDGFVAARPNARADVTIANPTQRLELPEVRFPRMGFSGGLTELQLEVPLSAIDVRPRSPAEFASAVKSVRLLPAWTDGEQVAEADVTITDGQLKLRFDGINPNAVGALPPVLVVRLQSGQTVQLELRPRTMKADLQQAGVENLEASLTQQRARLARLKADPSTQPWLVQSQEELVAANERELQRRQTTPDVSVEIPRYSR